MNALSSSKACGFRLEFLTLLQSDVKRNRKIPVEQLKSAIQKTEVEVSHIRPKENRLCVFLAVKHSVELNGQTVLELLVRYSANFCQTGFINAKGLNYFANVHAPGLIFPFVKESLAALSLEQFENPVLIDSIDFDKIYDERKHHTITAK